LWNGELTHVENPTIGGSNYASRVDLKFLLTFWCMNDTSYTTTAASTRIHKMNASVQIASWLTRNIFELGISVNVSLYVVVVDDIIHVHHYAIFAEIIACLNIGTRRPVVLCGHFCSAAIEDGDRHHCWFTSFLAGIRRLHLFIELKENYVVVVDLLNILAFNTVISELRFDTYAIFGVGSSHLLVAKFSKSF
jgi:hypothetical protein